MHEPFLPFSSFRYPHSPFPLTIPCLTVTPQLPSASLVHQNYHKTANSATLPNQFVVVPGSPPNPASRGLPFLRKELFSFKSRYGTFPTYSPPLSISPYAALPLPQTVAPRLIPFHDADIFSLVRFCFCPLAASATRSPPLMTPQDNSLLTAPNQISPSFPTSDP